MDQSSEIPGQASARERLVRQSLAIAVHVFTASGAALGLLALERAFAKDFQTMFAWLALALLVDGVDGTLARMARVKEHAPQFDGETLDLVVDFLTYAVVPFTAVWQAGLMPGVLGGPVLVVLSTASALYFADRRMKTPDHWFRGFPAIWNVAILYLFVFPAPSWAVAIILLALGAAIFAPIVFVHPMRVERLRGITAGVGGLWLVCAALIVFDNFNGPVAARIGLVAAAVYFVLLPLARRWPPAG